MKRIIPLFSILMLLLTNTSCDDINERILPRCTGKSGDLLIVADSSYYNNLTGNAIKNTFAVEQVGLPQREPLFNLIQVPHRSFARIFYTTRNIIMVKIKPDSKIQLTVNKEVWSETQLMVTITAPSDKLAAETITKNKEALLAYFNNAEINRLKIENSPNINSENAKHLREKFKLSIAVDDNFMIAKETKDFIWLRKELMAGEHPISYGLMIYTYPYISDSTFNVHALVKKRNNYTKKYVSGSVKGSYMISYKEYIPIQKEISLNGVYMNELRGLWEMKGDFMGGPYINYSLVDEKRNRVISLDGYVYAPKFDKRELLRKQEAIIKSITF